MNQNIPPKITMLINTIERDSVRAGTPEQAEAAIAEMLKRLDAEATLASMLWHSPGIPIGITFRHTSTGLADWRASVPCLTIFS